MSGPARSGPAWRRTPGRTRWRCWRRGGCKGARQGRGQWYNGGDNRRGNRVSAGEIESLTDTDIIPSDEQNSHVAVEISLTADERDLTRARERADILYRITDGTVYAVIVGQTIPDELREKAATLNVAVMQIEYKG